MKNCPVQVVKLGGSLLELPDLRDRFLGWLDQASAADPQGHSVIVVGGGALVEAVRQFHARATMSGKPGLDEELAHWICIDLMEVNARLVAAILTSPEIVLTADFEMLQARMQSPGATIFQTGDFLREIEPSRKGTPLPASWYVTSDSIAARLAVVIEAERLVLLKSTLPPLRRGVEDNGLARLAGFGYIDLHLAEMASELPPLQFTAL